ncbi:MULTISPECIES: leucine-rich repeat-containing protein kinase family protein [unclassified Shewanella]|uniref:leucine-rich repeat-containing protein kinase family protein n=1 Tax=unclassified Shewanella TaxID=196818 RepID=UPI000C822321|nr:MULTISPECIES: leucine-rich repeat-containing protein kinase family protein [unclassified Shewanella]MDO6621169.1 leucine-rich repeat-containing protein kinase family protein [Shewanella sp. 6_MG-2023]MDO6639476.1 leucine-rich repeat-containing protein kinase family protein [Shewanella sp. 5_MG-2023]MDO6680624.1 leucine-rich repeat-containing protein kinase family protein [Shewanella sp. 4_MG-2023]PMG30249.1 protein kinase [Shewanella sp. 10N.286.52.C2]PMH84845.1 protein kinase [Shewanella s
MHTLAQLQSGELHQNKIKRLQIAEGLTSFPMEIIKLADSLEVLDLSNNRLSSLPDEFEQLQQLKILFLSFNCFTDIPDVIAKCPKLEMIGFKANQITTVAEDCFPVDTRWLILTDNNIEQLPQSIGKLHRLQKFAMAGNKLNNLPPSMSQCTSLELLRISANELTVIPDWLFKLPNLAWLAFSGNPITAPVINSDDAAVNSGCALTPMAQLSLGEQLGQGASGVIYQAQWQQDSGTALDVAVKIFRGAVTSDGYPKDELHCCLQAGFHPNLIGVLGFIADADNLGLVMELIPQRYYNLGLPPSLETCTRDTFCDDMDISLRQIVTVMRSMAAALAHLHQHKVSHGDIYAHNTMIDSDANMLFGDFGAATDLSALAVEQAAYMQAIEVRALGNMLDDVLGHFNEFTGHDNNQLRLATADSQIISQLSQIVSSCLQADVAMRPQFIHIQQQLATIQQQLLD